MPHNTNQYARQQHIGVYRINCKECSQSQVYIGETGRSFKLRIGKHKNNCKRYVNERSAIADHTATHNNAIDFDSGCVIYPENNSAKRKISESLYIMSEQVFESNSPLIHLFIF